MAVDMGRAQGQITLSASQFFEQVSQIKSSFSELRGAAEDASRGVEDVDTAIKGAGSDLSGITGARDKTTELGTKAQEAGKKIGDAFKAAGEKISAVGDKIQAVGQKMSSIGGTMTRKVTTPIVALGTLAVKKTADFEAAMSNVAAISGATGEELEQLSDKAQLMGRTSKFTATEAANALSYMAMAGWRTEDMLNGLDGVMALAAASGEDLATTSDIVTDAMTAFGMSAEESAHFADVLAAAATSSNTDVGKLGESFKYVAPLAGTLGFTIEDTTFALGLMASNGVKASTAGTTLRAAFLRLTKPTKQAKEVLDKYGLSLLNSDGTIKSLSEVIDMLRDSFSEMTEAEKAQNATLLFGQNASTGMLALINSSTDAYDELSEAIYNADGTAQSMSKIQLDNFAGQITYLKSQLEGVAIQFGELIVPALSKFMDKISELLTWLSSLDEDTKQMIINGALVLAVLGPILKVFGTLTTVIGGVVKAVGNLVSAFGWLAPKIGSALSTVGGVASKGFGAIVSAAKAIGPQVSSALGAIAPYALSGLAVVGAAIAGWEIGSLIYDTWGPQIEEFLFPIFDFFVELWDKIVNFFTETIPEFFVTLGETISAGWNTIVEFFAGVWEEIKNFFVTIATYIWDSFLGPIVEAVTATVQKIYEIVAKIFEIIWALLSTAGKLIWDYVINPIWEGIKWLVDTIGGFFSDLWDLIVAIFAGAWNWVDETIITPLWEGIKWVVDEIAGFFSGLWDGIVEVFTGVADWFGGIFEDAWDAIVDVFDGVTDWFSELWEDIKEVFSDAATAVGDFFEGAFQTVFNWIMEGVEDVVNFFIDGVNGVIDIINAIPGVEISALDRLELPRLSVGLDYVPYDGYVAQLHQGERVLTKEENEAYSNQGTESQGGNTFNFYSPEPIDEITAAQEFKRVEQELAEGV